MDTTLGLESSGKGSSSAEAGEGAVESKESAKRFGDAPPVFVMPDGYSYMHVKRNGLIFGCATEKNISPVVVIEVGNLFLLLFALCPFSSFCQHKTCIAIKSVSIAPVKDCKGLQRLLWYSLGRVH